ncbi:unnamed protein product [Hermetia illucens]|uniref:Cytochrome P450 303a1 n=2 Tax=Hermetia illucens TaxID=343691 RepID=A0A7R8UXT3_HERIL|nr:probable cytochrome P450 303a1 isoform X3 [Hermetia illucens]XP_037916470.1 probable cytochrome P450 303a1 isoform X3 [Hermetia illucens]XP_037916471.1 probable cytochrome P450 303a1 isoform X3 [Hermetia illucens]CAD7088544.1 unnamed protein product [Hermetia illucens]
MFYTVIFFLFTTALWLFLDSRKPKNYPPGPTWYPILGSAPQIAQLRKKHGLFCYAAGELNDTYGKKGIIGLRIGKDRLVIAYSHQVSKELCYNEDLDGRPTGIFYETRTWGTRKGIILTDEDFWSEQRKFLVKHLKEFGFARQGMAELAQNEAQYLFEDVQAMVKQQGGKSAIIPVQNLFGVYVLNTLWTMMAGVRYDRQHDELKEIQSLFHDLFKNIDMVGCMFSHFPFLRYIAPNSSGYNHFLELHAKLFSFIARELEKHKKVFHPGNEPRDLMDSYLQELSEPNIKSSFSEKQLLAVCLDMFLAGSETTTKSLGFAFLYLTRNKDIQVRMQQELDAVIGRGRLPLWEDKDRLPYCESVIYESLRFFAGSSFGIPHRALRDTQLAGYNIPKDTMVISCFTGMLMDERNFEDVRTFRPERFIQNGKCVVPELFAPFGARHRRCMGENMAKQNLFLFITTLIQNFTFCVPEGQPMPDVTPQDGATPSVKPFTAKVVPR